MAAPSGRHAGASVPARTELTDRSCSGDSGCEALTAVSRDVQAVPNINAAATQNGADSARTLIRNGFRTGPRYRIVITLLHTLRSVTEMVRVAFRPVKRLHEFCRCCVPGVRHVKRPARLP